MFGRVIVFAEFVGQTCIRMQVYVVLGHPRQVLQIRQKRLRAQRTIQTNGEGSGVRDAVVEGFRLLKACCLTRP